MKHTCAASDQSSAMLACVSAAWWSKPALVQEFGASAAVQCDPSYTQRCTCIRSAVWPHCTRVSQHPGISLRYDFDRGQAPKVMVPAVSEGASRV